MDVIIYLDHDLILDVMYMIYLSPQTGAAPPCPGLSSWLARETHDLRGPC